MTLEEAQKLSNEFFAKHLTKEEMKLVSLSVPAHDLIDAPIAAELEHKLKHLPGYMRVTCCFGVRVNFCWEKSSAELEPVLEILGSGQRSTQGNCITWKYDTFKLQATPKHCERVCVGTKEVPRYVTLCGEELEVWKKEQEEEA